MRRVAKKAVVKATKKDKTKNQIKPQIKKVYKKSEILKYYFEQEFGREKYKKRRISYLYKNINNNIKKNILTNSDLCDIALLWNGKR
jgi:hypothetical protein